MIISLTARWSLFTAAQFQNTLNTIFSSFWLPSKGYVLLNVRDFQPLLSFQMFFQDKHCIFLFKCQQQSSNVVLQDFKHVDINGKRSLFEKPWKRHKLQTRENLQGKDYFVTWIWRNTRNLVLIFVNTGKWIIWIILYLSCLSLSVFSFLVGFLEGKKSTIKLKTMVFLAQLERLVIHPFV